MYSSAILQKLAEHICPLLLRLFWLSALRVFQSLFCLVPSQNKTTVYRDPCYFPQKNTREWFSHLLLFLSKDHLFAMRSHWSPQTSQAVQWYMFERLLSHRSSRDPNTALSDQNSRTGWWLGKQAAILMFFHRSYQWGCSRNVSGVFFYITEVFEEV